MLFHTPKTNLKNKNNVEWERYLKKIGISS